jgi:DNA polymerase III alpha subunit
MLLPLHIHSNYSLLEGVITLDEIIEKAVNYNLPAIALTDTNGMYGLISFYKKAIEKGIKPILGTYVDEPDNSGTVISTIPALSGEEKSPKMDKEISPPINLSADRQDRGRNDKTQNRKKIYALFLAKNFDGYSDICRIITARKLKDEFSLFKLLQNEFPNLFILTNSIELLQNIPSYKNIYAELIITDLHKFNSRKLLEAAKAKNVKYVITNPVYFSEPEDYLLHRVVTAIKNRGTFENLDDNELVDKEFCFKHLSSFDYLKNKIPEAFANIDFIASHCNVDLSLGQYKIPDFPDQPACLTARQAGQAVEKDTYSKLWQYSYEGLKRRYGETAESIKSRLQEELDVIYDLSLADYFLIVHDIFLEAKKRRMMTVTRGSAANSLVCYCLGLTEVDPVKHNFYFTRFLNKSRSSLPDIDIDFSWKERDEIVQYVFQKYGYSKVAFISTHVTIKARSAFRETAKVFGFSEEEISKLSRYIPWTDARNLPEISKRFPESKSLNFDDEPWKSIINIAARLANFPRHLSIHPGGIIITPQPITTYTAVEFAKNKGVGLIITQPDMYGVEDMGLVKIDLLSQRSLGVLRDSMQQIKENGTESHPEPVEG